MRQRHKSTTLLIGTKAFTPRVRFSWGFWDAQCDVRNGLRCQDELWIGRHFDKAYAKGYSAGKNWNDADAATSDMAWQQSRVV